MKSELLKLKLKCGLLAVLFAVAWDCSAAPAKTSSTTASAPAAPAEPPKSEFEDGVVKAPLRDPFFPKSTRYVVNQVAKPRVPDEGTPAPKVDCYSDIVVKGISISTRRFATVNNQTFAPGDELAVKTSHGPVKIKVIEIKERSVVVKAEGNCEPKELPLKY